MARVLARKGCTRVALVGAGAGGVEFLLSVERRLRHESCVPAFRSGGLSFMLSGRLDILPDFPAGFVHASAPSLPRGMRSSAPRHGVEAGRLPLDGQAPVEADEILWTTQAAPARWLGKTGLPLDEKGFLKVDDTLRVVGHDNVFAAGDTIAFAPRPCRSRECTPCVPVQCWRTISAARCPAGRCGHFDRSARRSIWSRPASAMRSAPAMAGG